MKILSFLRSYENHEINVILYEKHKNNENLRISYENLANYENHRIPLKIYKNNANLKIVHRITPIKKILEFVWESQKLLKS